MTTSLWNLIRQLPIPFRRPRYMCATEPDDEFRAFLEKIEREAEGESPNTSPS